MSLILNALKSHSGQSVALIGDKVSLTYSELIAAIDMRAQELQAANVSVFAIALDNGVDWIVWDLACVKASIPCIPIAPFMSEEQRDHVLKSAGVTHMITPSGLTFKVYFQDNNLPSGTAKITYTSGTTGTPKGVCLSQDGMEQVAASLIKILGTDLAKRHLCVLPLAILLENIAGVYATLLAGGTIYVPSLITIGFKNVFQPDFKALARYMAQQKITSVIMVPEILRGIIHTGAYFPDLEFLAVGGSKISPELIGEAREFGFPVYEGYGLSECASVVSLNTPQHDKAGSVGCVLPHIQLSEENGEIIIKNPAFLGYVGEKHSGDFPTGDLGHIDHEGFLHIDGRKKNVLITSYGRNISPEWVESVLLSRSEIAQAVIYGDAKAYLSALIVPAYVGANIEKAIESANTSLPEYAHIKAFQIVAPFHSANKTLTATGRPRREIIFNINHSIMTQENSHESI
jgi:long-subunit acyl-CoA synthetase (AMP-forming)